MLTTLSIEVMWAQILFATIQASTVSDVVASGSTVRSPDIIFSTTIKSVTKLRQLFSNNSHRDLCVELLSVPAHLEQVRLFILFVLPATPGTCTASHCH